MASRLTGCEVLPAFLERVDEVFVRQVHQEPLEPYAIILMLEFKVLKPTVVEVFHEGDVAPSHLDLGLTLLIQINLLEYFIQYGLGDPTDARSGIERTAPRRQVAYEFFENIYAVGGFYGMMLAISSAYAIDRRWLVVPILLANFVPALTVTNRIADELLLFRLLGLV